MTSTFRTITSGTLDCQRNSRFTKVPDAAQI